MARTVNDLLLWFEDHAEEIMGEIGEIEEINWTADPPAMYLGTKWRSWKLFEGCNDNIVIWDEETHEEAEI